MITFPVVTYRNCCCVHYSANVLLLVVIFVAVVAVVVLVVLVVFDFRYTLFFDWFFYLHAFHFSDSRHHE